MRSVWEEGGNESRESSGDEGAFRDEISVVSPPSCMLEEP